MAELDSNRTAFISRTELEESPLQPDILLPAQFYDRRRSMARFEPSRRLMAAVLTDAVECFQRYSGAQGGSRKALFLEAQRWLFGIGQNGPFSFGTICDALEINPKRLRRALLEWRDRKLVGEVPPRVTRRSPVAYQPKVASAPGARRRRASTLHA